MLVLLMLNRTSHRGVCRRGVASDRSRPIAWAQVQVAVASFDMAEHQRQKERALKRELEEKKKTKSDPTLRLSQVCGIVLAPRPNRNAHASELSCVVTSVHLLHSLANVPPLDPLSDRWRAGTKARTSLRRSKRGDTAPWRSSAASNPVCMRPT
eukprot:126045-Rhodomonas_salina.5